MVKIRLARKGKRNDPFYRIVAIDSRNPQRGRALDVIGYWHPREGVKKFDKKLFKSWVDRGAQVTEAVEKLINEETT